MLELAAPSGIFCVLFVCLLFFVMKTNSEQVNKSDAREQRLEGMIDGYRVEIGKLYTMVEKQNTELNKLASVVDKLYDKITEK